MFPLELLSHLVCRYDHHAREVRDIHADDPIEPAGYMLGYLQHSVVNMLICARMNLSEIGAVVDVYVDHLDPIDDDGFACLVGARPEVRLGRRVDDILDWS